MSHTLKLKTYLVPHIIDDEGNLIEDITKPITSRELVEEEEVELEEISVELLPLSKKVAQYNQRQLKYFEGKDVEEDEDGNCRVLIKKRIITKQ